MVLVDADNFVRAETDLMFSSFAASAGGVNRWRHERAMADIDDQLVVRLNRDTLYSFAVVDLAEGATLTVPDAGARYVSVMVVSRDHHVHRIIHDPGRHALTVDDAGSRYAALVVRILADPEDADDLAVAHALQDELAIDAGSSEPFEHPDYDRTSLDGVRRALKELGRFSSGTARTFGRPEDVDPVRHLTGTAMGWGGLPESEATYVNVEPALPVGEYRVEVADVPVDGFWSLSVYDADGYFEPNDLGRYSVNSVTAERAPDGSVTVHLGGCDDGRANCIPLPEGWNYLVRLYRPRPEILDGSWRFPAVEVAPRTDLAAGASS